MNEPKKRGRPAKAKEAKEKPSDSQGSYDDNEIVIFGADIQGDAIVCGSPVVIRRKDSDSWRIVPTQETVAKVEAEIGRTANAWGMIDPLELIRAVDRVLRGEGHE